MVEGKGSCCGRGSRGSHGEVEAMGRGRRRCNASAWTRVLGWKSQERKVVLLVATDCESVGGFWRRWARFRCFALWWYCFRRRIGSWSIAVVCRLLLFGHDRRQIKMKGLSNVSIQNTETIFQCNIPKVFLEELDDLRRHVVPHNVYHRSQNQCRCSSKKH